MLRSDLARTLVVLTLGVLASPACQCGSLEIGPTNVLARGTYSGLWGHPWGSKQKYVLADHHVPDAGAPLLTVARVDAKTSCDIAVAAPAWYFSMGESLMAFEAIDWDRWTGRLVEVALPCGPTRVLAENVYLAVWRDETESYFYAVVELDAGGVGRLVRIDMPAGTSREILARQSTDYLDFDWPDPRFFYRDQGELVAVGLDGVEEARFGHGVTYYTSSGTGEVIWEERPAMFYGTIADRGFMQLSQNACYPTFTEDWILHYEPCVDAPRRLVVRARDTRAVLGRYGSGIARYGVGPKSWLSWLENASGATTGTLWAKSDTGEPKLVAEGALPSWRILGESSRVLYGQPSLPTRAKLVSQDLLTGERFEMSADVDATLPIAESPWSPHFAMVENLVDVPPVDGGVDGGVATRVGSLVGVHPSTQERVPVADRVPLRAWRFSWQAPAIGYLYGFDAVTRTGAFEVLSMVDRKRYPVDTGVTTFDEVYGPKRGVVYVVGAPGREGLYFVEADVHIF